MRRFYWLLEQTRKEITQYLVHEDSKINFEPCIQGIRMSQRTGEPAGVIDFRVSETLEICAVLCFLGLIVEASSASCRSRVNFVAGIFTDLSWSSSETSSKLMGRMKSRNWRFRSAEPGVPSALRNAFFIFVSLWSYVCWYSYYNTWHWTSSSSRDSSWSLPLGFGRHIDNLPSFVLLWFISSPTTVLIFPSDLRI